MTLPSPGVVKDADTQRALDRIREHFPLGSEHIQEGAVGVAQGPAFVNSTTEHLKTIRGVVDSTSTTPVEGLGFTLAINGTGDMTITFAEAFSDVPTIQYTVGETAGTLTAKHNATPTTTTGDVLIFDTTTGTATDAIFHFTAIGPR